MRLPDNITHGDKYWKAMEAQTETEAQDYLDACIEHCMRFGKTREEAVEIEKCNIGYWTGYCDHAKADLVMRLYDCVHPYFGRGHPAAEKILEMGRALGAAQRCGGGVRRSSHRSNGTWPK